MPPVRRATCSTRVLAFAVTMVIGTSRGAEPAPSGTLRAGIIGLDTSHVTAFTTVLNGPKDLGVRVVAAYPAGSPDVVASHTRIENFTKELRDKFQVEIVDSIPALLSKVDVVFLESVDGRPHLEQVKPVLRAHKPVFVDKPFAGSLTDAVRIVNLARETGTPCFSSSSLRFDPRLAALRDDPKIGAIQGCDVRSPCDLEEHHPDLFWYGIHGVEMLYTLMGTGCRTVTRVQTKDSEFVTGTWADGRIGTYRGLRTKKDYGVVVCGTEANAEEHGFGGAYEPMLREICTFFKTGKPPVSPEETVEIFAFMQAADESKKQGGAPVSLETVMAKARADAAESAEPGGGKAN